MKNLGNYLSVSSEMKIVFRKNKEWEHTHTYTKWGEEKKEREKQDSERD